jgi:putative Mn2+ efflux pump MntP
VTRDQKIVGIGAASGVAAMAVALLALYRFWPVNSALSGLTGRLAYTLQVDLLAALPLLLGVIAVANNRFLSESIDPTLQKESLATQINGRVLDNTLQQYVLFALATLALSINLNASQMRIIPAAAAVFVAACAAFWIGYRIGPLYRAFGMAATMYLNLGLVAFAIWRNVGG